MRCKHKNVILLEGVVAEHQRELVDGQIHLNNEMGGGVYRQMNCLDCGYKVKFNWRKNVPKWITERLQQMGLNP